MVGKSIGLGVASSGFGFLKGVPRGGGVDPINVSGIAETSGEQLITAETPALVSPPGEGELIPPPRQ